MSRQEKPLFPNQGPITFTIIRQPDAKRRAAFIALITGGPTPSGTSTPSNTPGEKRAG